MVTRGGSCSLQKKKNRTGRWLLRESDAPTSGSTTTSKRHVENADANSTRTPHDLHIELSALWTDLQRRERQGTPKLISTKEQHKSSETSKRQIVWLGSKMQTLSKSLFLTELKRREVTRSPRPMLFDMTKGRRALQLRPRH